VTSREAIWVHLLCKTYGCLPHEVMRWSYEEYSLNVAVLRAGLEAEAEANGRSATGKSGNDDPSLEEMLLGME
jgi:hypothetical protein